MGVAGVPLQGSGGFKKGSCNQHVVWTHVEQAWQDAYPSLSNLNINLAAPCDERDKTIAKLVDTMALVNMSSHFCQQCGKLSQGRWTWRMRRGDAGSPLSVTTSWGGQPTWDDGFGASASKCLFVITPTIALFLLKFVQGEGRR